MAVEKEPDPKVEFNDTKLKQSSRKTKVIIITALTVVLLLGAVVLVTLYFTLQTATPDPTRLTEVNMEKGDTLTYQVDQDIEAQAGNVKQKGTIRAMVHIRVLNKTSEEYWFLMKFNLSHMDGNVDIMDVNVTIDFFLVRLHLDSRKPSHSSNASGVSFEIYGTNSTNEEKVRFVFGILQQLLPTVKRDLYEDVDGKKAAGSNPLKPEESPLLPDSVKMHREANTSDKDTVSIKNHFDRSDFVRMLSEIDLDVKYSDFALIKKSNGMVKESRVYFSEQLNFGEGIDSEDGVGVTMMKITLTSRVSLIENHYFGFADLEEVNFHFLVKLVVPKATATFSANETQGQMPSDVSFPSQQQNSDNSSVISLKRSRRSLDYYNGSNVNASLIAEIFERIPAVCLNVDRTFILLNGHVSGIGVYVRVTASLSVNIDGAGSPEIEVKLTLDVGRISLTVFRQNFTIPPQIGMGFNLTLPERNETLIFKVRVFGVRLTVQFKLTFRVQFRLSFPSEGNSLVPLKLKVKVEPIALILLRVTAKESHWHGYYNYGIKVDGKGKLMQVGLPVTLSFFDGKLCVSLSADLISPDLRGGIYKQCIKWKRKWKWIWRWVRSAYRVRRRQRRRGRWLTRWYWSIKNVRVFQWVPLYYWCNRKPLRFRGWFPVRNVINLLEVCNMTKNVTNSTSPTLTPTTQITLSIPTIEITPTTEVSTPTILTTSTAATTSPLPTTSSTPPTTSSTPPTTSSTPPSTSSTPPTTSSTPPSTSSTPPTTSSTPPTTSSTPPSTSSTPPTTSSTPPTTSSTPPTTSSTPPTTSSTPPTTSSTPPTTSSTPPTTSSTPPTTSSTPPTTSSTPPTTSSTPPTTSSTPPTTSSTPPTTTTASTAQVSVSV